MASPTRHVAFLGGVNVGGHRVTMERLRLEVERLGFTDVGTFIASGNLIFSVPGSATDGDLLAATLSEGLEAALGWPVPAYVRTAQQLIRAVDLEPFGPPQEGVTHMILFCASAPDAAIEARSDEHEGFAVHGTEVHWRIRGGVSDSRLTLPRLPTLLGTTCTSRNAKSLRVLADQLRA